MLMPASLTRSRSREFLASAASEPLQPRSLRIQPTLVKKHMYYPRREIPTLFPIVHLFHSKPLQFLLSMQNRTRDVMTFFPERNYLKIVPTIHFCRNSISYSLAPIASWLLIDNLIRFSSLDATMSNLFLDCRKMCPFTIKRVSSESIAVGTWQSVGNMSYFQVSLRLICFRYHVDNLSDAVPTRAWVFSNLKRSAREILIRWSGEFEF